MIPLIHGRYGNVAPIGGIPEAAVSRVVRLLNGGEIDGGDTFVLAGYDFETDVVGTVASDVVDYVSNHIEDYPNIILAEWNSELGADGEAIFTCLAGAAANDLEFSCSNPSWQFADYKPNGDPCDVRVTGIGAGDYLYSSHGDFGVGDLPYWNLQGHPIDSDNYSLVGGNFSGCWDISDGTATSINESTEVPIAPVPYLADWTGSTVTAIPAGMDGTW